MEFEGWVREGECGVMYLTQIRKENVKRGIDLRDFINGYGRARDWENDLQFKDIEDAKRRAESLISSENFKAKDVRIVEVVCTFESEVIVKQRRVRSEPSTTHQTSI